MSGCSMDCFLWEANSMKAEWVNLLDAVSAEAMSLGSRFQNKQPGSGLECRVTGSDRRYAFLL